jgi:hypothetical protein
MRLNYANCLLALLLILLQPKHSFASTISIGGGGSEYISGEASYSDWGYLLNRGYNFHFDYYFYDLSNHAQIGFRFAVNYWHEKHITYGEYIQREETDMKAVIFEFIPSARIETDWQRNFNPFVQLGFGLYAFKGDRSIKGYMDGGQSPSAVGVGLESDARLGSNIGGGLMIGKRIGLELQTLFNIIFTDGKIPKYLTASAGVYFRY